MRRAARIDNSQTAIVKSLRAIKGISVALGHDDILVGYNGRTYWFEVKNESCVNKKTGKLRPNVLQSSQVALSKDWAGHYQVVWNVDQILKEISYEE